MNYYENEHGKDLREFMIKNNPYSWAVFSYVNAMKYSIRAGKKQGEALEKDLSKRDDYIEDYSECCNIDLKEAYDRLNEALNEFADYDN